MKKLLLVSILLPLAFGTAHAQTSLIHHTVVKTRNNPPAMGRDFWIAMPSNQWGEDLGGKYMRIYITSPNNTTAFVESNGAETPVPVQAYRVSSFKIPEFWENESSGIVENKAIHVYSKTADLSVYFMSHQAYSSDGSYAIPTIGWGTDYVVAAYGSFFEGGKAQYDLPSECVVIANQDQTQLTITPSCDCRFCSGGNQDGDSCSNVVGFPAGLPQTFTLNRGQCIQLMPVKASDPDNFDMTGTIIHSDQPVGVIGASVQPNIPASFAYSDFVCEMIPPVRTWGKTYYATNPIQPPGSYNDFARYLFISSVPGQEIDRYDYATGSHTECVIPNQYGFYWDELESAQRFTSDEPFLCVWYINSSTFPAGAISNGDPAECIIPSLDQYMTTTIFQTPQTVGNIVPFTNYAILIVADTDARYTYFEGQTITGVGHVPIDGIFSAYIVPKIAPGVHTVYQDLVRCPTAKGVGIYLYGYGYDETYAWGTPVKCATINSPDTISPIADTSSECFEAYIHLADSGLLPDRTNKQSGLSMIRLESAQNMNYMPDVPALVEGSGADTSGYGMSVIDPSLPAILVVEVYDVAGNETKITSVYKPEIDSIKPAWHNLGVTTTAPPNIGYDTIYNTGQVPFNITELKLRYNNLGFSIFSSTGGPVDMSPIPPGGYRVIMIKFTALTSTRAVDTILCSDGCITAVAALYGSGGAADFIVTDQTWPNELLGNCYFKTVTVENLSENAISIDTAWWSDNVHFKAVTKFPLTVPASPGSAQFVIEYCPDSSSLPMPNRTQGTWFSHAVTNNGSESPRFDSLIGWAVGPSETFTNDTSISIDCQSDDSIITLSFTITAAGTASSVISRVTQSDPTDFPTLFGTLDNGNTWDPTTSPQTLQPGYTAIISAQCTAKGKQNFRLVDTVTAYDGSNKAIGKPLVGIVQANFAAGAVNPAKTVFPPVQFQSPNSAANSQTFTIQNTANSPLDIVAVQLEVGGKYDEAFSITSIETVPANGAVTFPFSLPGSQSLLVTVAFNDSISDDPVQTALVLIGSDNSCTDLSEPLSATISNSGVTEQNAPTLGATNIPSEDGRSLEILIPPGQNEPISFELFNVLGERVLRSAFQTGTRSMDASELLRGVYFYRLSSSNGTQSGKVILGE